LQMAPAKSPPLLLISPTQLKADAIGGMWDGEGSLK
jgi:hypothetical protein